MEDKFDTWYKDYIDDENKPVREAAKAAWDAQQYEIERLQARIAELEKELVKESKRTAEQKLRADQMTKQHAMQSKMHSDLAHKLAEMKG